MSYNETFIHTINGVDYFDSLDFCFLVRKSKVTINNLIRYGNKIRKLKCVRPRNNQSFIPVSELTEYPFTTGGWDNKVYKHDKFGNRVYTNQSVDDYIQGIMDGRS